jgi:tRNA nucleotidyltransferase (CCA-adding enzyme)
MIKITFLEQKIFDLLLETLKQSKINITLRVAGGWVRDKLLGNECNDIDIALDNIMGKDFVQIFHNHLIEKNIESHGFGVIKKNAEQSKHLETATIQIFGMWIDFVNLRGEEYTEDSRIPIQVIGTPEDDAFRRDFTINSLFYNINDGKIEDFTKKGLEDLKNKIIRTPLCPKQTFLDDPLRILRGFRFSARYNYEIEKTAYDYMCFNKEIKTSFLQKISKERIGKEFESNFSYPEISVNPFKFIDYLYETEFLKIILNTELDEKVFHGYNLAKKLNQSKICLEKEFKIFLEETQEDFKSETLVYLTYISLLTFPFFDFNSKYSVLKNNKCFDIIREQMKLKRKAADFSTKLQISLKELEKLYLDKNLNKKELAVWQKKAESLWFLADKLFENIIHNQEIHGPYLNLTEYFENLHLTYFFKTKPILNGQEITEFFKIKGKDIKIKMDEILLWQINNPLITKEEYVKNLEAENTGKF